MPCVFDRQLGKLKLATRKGDGTVRSRFTKLSTVACAFFKEQCKGKTPRAPRGQ
jgi:hypothetical protein